MLCSNLLIFLGVHWGPTSPERLFQTRTRFLYGIELTFFNWDPPAFLKSGGTPLKKIRLVHRDPPTGTPLILVGPEAPTLSGDRRPFMSVIEVHSSAPSMDALHKRFHPKTIDVVL